MERVVLLAGGVGGSKLADGLARVLPAESLTIIGNVGDDIERHGLWVSPDIDILSYTLAGVVDKEKGWGFANETFDTLEALGHLGEETWFNLGDRDLATHILRTHLRREGRSATQIAAHIAESLGVHCTILPPTDDIVQTHVLTDQGWLHFQEYLVRDGARAEPLDVRFDGIDAARPTPEVLDAVDAASVIVIAPSNPVASIGPIVGIPGFRDAIIAASAPKVAVCPIVGGQSLKGPSDRMLRARGCTADPKGVVDYYGGLLDGLVIDEADVAFEEPLRKAGLHVHVTRTVMSAPADRTALARTVMDFVDSSSLSRHKAAPTEEKETSRSNVGAVFLSCVARRAKKEHRDSSGIPEKGHRNLRKGRVSVPGASYFLTICTNDRQTGLATDELLTGVVDVNTQMDEECAWRLRVLTLMPDHLHAVVRLHEDAGLSQCLKTFKGRTAPLLRENGLRWQKGAFEHRIRPAERLGPVFHYIYMNPYRKNLIGGHQTWPYFYCSDEDWAWFQPMLNDNLPYPEWLL
jgi:LPPG:FO 2-phospho-L-lactate transferase